MSTVTKRITPVRSKKSTQGFISWFSDAVFEQKEINSLISIGRDSSQMIILDDPFTSRRHARIEKKTDNSGEYILKDMSSRNGTFLNGNKVFQALLKNNDRIKIGKTELIFSSQRFNHTWTLFHRSLNPHWNQQLSRIPSMAQTDFPILISGPSGTGKEHLAQMIHNHSHCNLGPYVSVNCSALTETLAESEFFGHVRGAYTGAEQNRKGAFLAAHEGTLFLDEIGDLPLNLQPKLLRALECKEIKPVGSDTTSNVHVRIVSATHQNLQKKVLEKQFREDLYFRLRVLEVKPPPLKDRIEDFDPILDFFSAKFGVSFSNSARKSLKNYSWPGNIRELKNTVARARALFPHSVVQASSIRDILDPLYDISQNTNNNSSKSLPLLKQIEKEILIRVLTEHNGNKKQASLQLNMPRTTLGEKLKYYGITIKNAPIIK